MTHEQRTEIVKILGTLATSFERSATDPRKKFRASERAMTLAEVKRYRELAEALLLVPL